MSASAESGTGCPPFAAYCKKATIFGGSSPGASEAGNSSRVFGLLRESPKGVK